MVNKASRAEIREKKHRRLRHHLNGTATTPRLAVFRSLITHFSISCYTAETT